MSVFSGRQDDPRTMREHRERKREQAEARNKALSPTSPRRKRNRITT